MMIDAGAITYFAIAKDIAHVAGCYAVEDWMMVDERAERFRPLLNDEYSNAFLGELVGSMTNPSQRINEYSMMLHADTPTRMFSHIPYSVLDGGNYTRTVGPLRPGRSHLDAKQDRYTTSQGVLTLAQYNRRAQAHTPAVCSPRFRHLCETWLKYHHQSPLADELYCIEQQYSRKLAGCGAGLKRADIEALRDKL